MNTQRREEILALIADQNGTHAMDDYRAALIDAMDWISQLEAKAAERVIADGAKGPTPDYTGEGSAWVPPKAEVPAVVALDLECPRVEQTVAHVPGVSKGNCFAAVLAGLLKVPIESVPDFDGEDWQKQVNSWLRQFGLAWIQVGGLEEWIPQVGIEGCWHEMSGPTDRFDGKVRHAVAALDGKPQWDPHPSQSGLVEADGGSIFVALRPWELASRAIPADRVLGEGMVQVDAARLAALESISAKIESLALGPDGRAWTPLHYREFARGELRAALRANQGGATT